MWKPRSLNTSGDSHRIYIFVTSWQPDPYVNVLVHALQHFNLTHVYFISVAEHGYTHEDDAEERQRGLGTIRANIEARVQELSQGRYTRSRASGEGSQPEIVEIDPSHAKLYRDCYARLERIENTSVVIPWSELDDRLALFSRDGRAIFDVTALKKNLLVDTVVLLISRGCTRVFDFEILKKGPRFYNELELIHNLKESDNLLRGDFIYRNLAENAHVRRAESRMVARSFQFRSLIIITATVGVLILLVQIFFSKSWAETAIAIAATTAAIAAWLFLLRRD